MKGESRENTLVTAIIALVAPSVCLGAGTGDWMVIGKVISVTDAGVLVRCDSQGTLGKKKPETAPWFSSTPAPTAQMATRCVSLA